MSIENIFDENTVVLNNSSKSTVNNILEKEIYNSINDTRPSIPHEQVMADMDVLIKYYAGNSI